MGYVEDRRADSRASGVAVSATGVIRLRCSAAAALQSEGTTLRAILWLKVNVFKSEMADVDPDNCLNLVREYSEYPAAL